MSLEIKTKLLLADYEVIQGEGQNRAGLPRVVLDRDHGACLAARVLGRAKKHHPVIVQPVVEIVPVPGGEFDYAPRVREVRPQKPS